jgi:hypothetical protein
VVSAGRVSVSEGIFICNSNYLGLWARSELSDFTDLSYICSFFGRPKNEPKKDARAIWSFGLLCAPQSCRDFKNSLRSNSLKSFIDIFSGAQQMPMGKFINSAP